MIPDRIIQRLRRIVGENFVSTSRPDAEIYSYDASLARGAPDAVVFPRNTEEAVLVVRAALQVLRKIGKSITILDNCCCGLPLIFIQMYALDNVGLGEWRPACRAGVFRSGLTGRALKLIEKTGIETYTAQVDFVTSELVNF